MESMDMSSQLDYDLMLENSGRVDRLMCSPIPKIASTEAADENDDASKNVFHLHQSLQAFEEDYLKECAKNRPAPGAKFNYAWALVKSQSRAHIKKGVTLLRGLSFDHYRPADCLYYCAVGYYRLDNLYESRRCLKQLLSFNEKYRPAISLMDILDDRIRREAATGLAVLGTIISTSAMVYVSLSKFQEA
mmetsp:Transcript_42025/g.164611  ORF Transcript_42025/g.164611 Transcript_42025/m.164611 type:complete len:190 (-) Transcript_42025:844-1413(-)